jgi:hypothetical protein
MDSYVTYFEPLLKNHFQELHLYFGTDLNVFPLVQNLFVTNPSPSQACLYFL